MSIGSLPIQLPQKSTLFCSRKTESDLYSSIFLLSEFLEYHLENHNTNVIYKFLKIVRKLFFSSLYFEISLRTDLFGSWTVMHFQNQIFCRQTSRMNSNFSLREEKKFSLHFNSQKSY